MYALKSGTSLVCLIADFEIKENYEMYGDENGIREGVKLPALGSTNNLKSFRLSCYSTNARLSLLRYEMKSCSHHH